MADVTLQQLETEVWKYVETLRDSPEARMESRDAFYKKYGQEDSSYEYGYGDSEIAFLGWEERCVLRPPNANPPGSAWWSNVNLWFIYQSELGAKAYDISFPKAKLPAAAHLWTLFIEDPNPKIWYRAHNSSIIDGYLKYPGLAVKENIPEKIFINMVLYRLLYAQSMVEGEFIFPKLGKILGDPRGIAVDIITHLDAYYPSSYPMSKKDINEVMGRVHSLGELGVKFLDDVLIEPELTQLYHAASEWNKQPALPSLIVHHKPAYPYHEDLPDTHKGCIISLLLWIRKLLLNK
jgi:hypothetical protein